MINLKKRVLALDVGYKKIGVAISDINHTIITPKPVIFLEKFNGKKMYEELKTMLNNIWEEIGVVVIGLPHKSNEMMHNSPMKYVMQTIRIFKAWTNFEIELVDEKYSSVMAEEYLKQLQINVKKQKMISDSYAALKLLHDYFQKHKNDVIIGQFQR